MTVHQTPKKVFITGGSGFLGWNLIPALASIEGVSIHAARHASPLPKASGMITHDCDLTASGALAGLIRHVNPDVIIHAAALSGSVDCEKNPAVARRINVESTREIVSAAGASARIIFISTDLVFNGLNPPYRESDPPDPRMVYSSTKVEAEEIVKNAVPDHVILRVSLMYGPASPSHASFLDWMARAMSMGGSDLFVDEYRTPLYVMDAVEAISRLVKNHYIGILHLGGAQRCSRYEFGVEYARQAGLNIRAARPVRLAESKTSTYRPPDVSLDSSRAGVILGFRPQDYRQGIDEYLKTNPGGGLS